MKKILLTWKDDLALFILLMANIASALFNNVVGDCDETFNYWEPLHYLVHGFGQQTWEYAPQYALRSYAYLTPYAGIGIALTKLGVHKLYQFYALRLVCALQCFVAEYYFVDGLRNRFGRRVALWSALLLAGSAGMYASASALLPSSFAMCTLMLSQGAWLNERYRLAVFCCAVGALLGWPFAALAAVPLAVAVNDRYGGAFFCVAAFKSFVVIVVPMILIDSYLYGQFTFAAFNIVDYNALRPRGAEGGANLYGVEQWHYYVRTALLNFNIMVPLSFACAIMATSRRWGAAVAYHSAPLIVWCIFFTLLAHKEERFLFVVYPLFASTAALCLDKMYGAFGSGTLARLLVYAVIVGSSTLSAMRLQLLEDNYSAPIKLWWEFSEELLPPPVRVAYGQGASNVSICVGKEWHRFPSSFFLPHRWHRLRYVDANVHSQLPAEFGAWPSTHVAAAPFNDRNAEERSRYIALSDCDFLVDLDPRELPPHGFDPLRWDVIARRDFVDRNNQLDGGGVAVDSLQTLLLRLRRVLYIPFITLPKPSMRPYLILEKKK